MSRVKAILEDNLSNLLSGNAMEFDVNRWVLLSDGEDIIPRLTQPFSYQVAYVNTNGASQSINIGGNYLAVQHNTSHL